MQKRPNNLTAGTRKTSSQQGEEEFVAREVKRFMEHMEPSFQQDLRNGMSEEAVNKWKEEYREDYAKDMRVIYKNREGAYRIGRMLENDYPKEMVDKLRKKIHVTELTDNEMVNIVIRVQKLVARQPKLSAEEMKTTIAELVNYGGMTRKELEEKIEATERLADEYARARQEEARAHQEEKRARQEAEKRYLEAREARLAAEARLAELKKANEAKKRPANTSERVQEPTMHSRGNEWMKFSNSMADVNNKKAKTDKAVEPTKTLSSAKKKPSSD